MISISFPIGRVSRRNRISLISIRTAIPSRPEGDAILAAEAGMIVVGGVTATEAAGRGRARAVAADLISVAVVRMPGGVPVPLGAESDRSEAGMTERRLTTVALNVSGSRFLQSAPGFFLTINTFPR